MAKHNGQSLDEVFSALSDSTRRAILQRLSRGEASVTELAKPFGVSLPTIHRHLQVLERAGFIDHEKRGRVRHVRLARMRRTNCQGSRRPAGPPMAEARNWLSQLETHWDNHLARLKQQIESSL